MPHDDNPVVHLSAAVHKVGTSLLPMHLTDTFRLFVERLAAAVPPPMDRTARMLLSEDTIEQALPSLPDDHMAGTIRAMSRNTACPTVIKGSDKTNVIPQSATAEIDCRILPGQTPESVIAELMALLGLTGEPGGKVTLELTRTSLATESPPDTELTEAIVKALAKHSPDAAAVPFMVPGGTDSRFLRPKGIVAYGFCPTLPDVDHKTVHGINERVSVRSLEFGLRVLWDVVGGMAFA
jgi:acetylornithine deacetylase/succinyl-diaminopimelate desuccinylase-like protein